MGKRRTRRQTNRLNIQILIEIAIKYSQPEYEDVILAIGLVNEPSDFTLNVQDLKQFYRDAFERIRAFTDMNFVLQDTFLPPYSNNSMLTPSDDDAQNVSTGLKDLYWKVI
jgi:glucan 1,3-beta-glucosidase